MANPSTPPSSLKTREVQVLPTSPQYEMIASRQQVNLFLAGQGSGKTTAAGFISGIFISTFPKAHGFIGANTYTQLSDSTLFRIRKVWKEIFNWTEYTKGNPRGNFVVDVQPPAHFNTKDHEYDSYHGKICFQNGTVIYKGSLDNYKAHDGKEFAWAILDETKDTKEEAVKEVITGRLRESGMWVDASGALTQDAGGMPFNPLYIFTSPAKVPWINEWFRLDDYQDEIVRLIYSAETYFCQKIDNKLAVISSSYHNQANLPANFIENQKANLHTALIDMLIYGNPFSQSGGEFYKCFDRTRHVKDVRKIPGFDDGPRAYNPKLALHASFDFNVNPYMTLTIWQLVGKKAYQIDEICLANPGNTTPAICREFIRRYQGHTAGLFIYGDPTGVQEDTRSEKGSNDFTLILKILASFQPRRRVATAAPPVMMRGNWINTILEKGHEGIEIIIHESCKNSIGDYTYLKEASDGTKLKEKTKNTDTQVTYEKWGHCFIGDTLITTDQGEKRIDQIIPGDMVLTRKGYKKVLNRWDNGIQTVQTYRIEDKEISCTPDHKFWTQENDFKEIKYLTHSATFCILDQNNIPCKKKSLCIGGLPSHDMQTQKEDPNGFISAVMFESTTDGKKLDCTFTNGYARKVLFRRNITSIIRMKIRSIMTLKIWNVNQVRFIFRNMEKTHRRNLKIAESKYFLPELRKRQKNGINLNMAEHGTATTQKKQFKDRPGQSLAMNAEKNPQPPVYDKLDFVHDAVNQDIMPGFSGKERVYDLSVEDEHEYFANGILVHNCSDANDYLLCFAFMAEFQRYQSGGSGAPPKTGKPVSKSTY